MYLDRVLDCDLDCDLDRDPEDLPVYIGHSLFNTTKRITLLLIVQSLLHRNPPTSNVWIKIIHPNRVFTRDKIPRSRSLSRARFGYFCSV